MFYNYDTNLNSASSILCKHITQVKKFDKKELHQVHNDFFSFIHLSIKADTCLIFTGTVSTDFEETKQLLPTLQRHNTGNSKKIFPEKELRGHSPKFNNHVSVSDLYIPTIGLSIVLQEKMWTDPESI